MAVRPTVAVPLTVAAVGVALVASAAMYVVATGLSSRPSPGGLEARVARFVRARAIPREARARTNPVPASPEAIEAGLAHFADHCAVCHANDGSGETSLGQGLFPRPPDMRAEPTQQMTDGELFYVIENGVRFTGMPAFGTGAPDGERASWELVHFIRRLPTLTADELARMERMNPRPPAEVRQEIEDELFLQGITLPPAEASHGGTHP